MQMKRLLDFLQSLIDILKTKYLKKKSMHLNPILTALNMYYFSPFAELPSLILV